MTRGQWIARWGTTLALSWAAVFSGLPGAPTASAADGALWFDDAASATLTVSGGRFYDARGREVVMRGFNVSGEVKLEENGGLPFASVADARKSAVAMRELAGANSIRFLLSWAHAEPTAGTLDTTYMAKVAAQMAVFLDLGFRVLPDFHQDLYSRHLFNTGSWYTGDGAPKWVVTAGGYAQENCGICAHWGQNITQNDAVQDAMYDFWHNRTLTVAGVPGGTIGVQDAFLATAQRSMTYLKSNLTADQFSRVAGIDPYNEPYAGHYDTNQTSVTWERDLLWPFYVRFRARMDAAGWTAKAAFVEPNMYWNANLSFVKQEGGLANVGSPGTRYVFNTHYYDQAAISGVFMWGKAEDGQYSADFTDVRDHATTLGTAAVVTEFGHPFNGTTADKAPTVDKAMYQALDSRLPGDTWWSAPAGSGSVLSGMQWQWDLYSGRHNELMNDNPDKLLTEADAWNDEDLSAVELDDSGTAVLRQDARLLDRLQPNAVAGHTVAFTYEDRSRDGSTTLTWNPVPSTLPNVASLVGTGRYGVLAWRSGGSAGSTTAPTELHLPAGFPAAETTVISDLGTVTNPPAYAAGTPVAAAAEPGGTQSRRLLLSAPAEAAGTLHFALVAHTPTAPTAALRTAAQRELAQWAAAAAFPQ